MKLLALDARSGRVPWKKDMADPGLNYTATAAPLSRDLSAMYYPFLAVSQAHHGASHKWAVYIIVIAEPHKLGELLFPGWFV